MKQKRSRREQKKPHTGSSFRDVTHNTPAHRTCTTLDIHVQHTQKQSHGQDRVGSRAESLLLCASTEDHQRRVCRPRCRRCRPLFPGLCDFPGSSARAMVECFLDPMGDAYFGELLNRSVAACHGCWRRAEICRWGTDMART